MSDTVTVTIANKKGLHARAAAKFVGTVESFDAQVQVVKLGASPELHSASVGGTSILGLMMLGADLGSHITITAEGAQRAQVIEALKSLVENRFGEEE